jgi:hypothetical protein
VSAVLELQYGQQRLPYVAVCHRARPKAFKHCSNKSLKEEVALAGTSYTCYIDFYSNSVH